MRFLCVNGLFLVEITLRHYLTTVEGLLVVSKLEECLSSSRVYSSRTFVNQVLRKVLINTVEVQFLVALYQKYTKMFAGQNM